MKLRKLKSPNAGRLRRTALALGLAGGLAGGMLLAAAPAHAALGTETGLVLTPSSGATSTTPTWSTTVGCPSAESASAVVEFVYTNGTSYASASAVVNASSTLNLAAPFSGGSLAATMANIESLGGFASGGTQELFVQCASAAGGTGTVLNEMNVFVTYTGTNYATESSPPATSTTTTLTTSNASPTTCTAVTLTATEVAADSTNPAGNVQFLAGGTAIGGVVAVNSSGVATLSYTFTTTGTVSVTAMFTPTSSSYASSTSNTVTETVTAGTGCNTGTEPISVTIPTSGTFTLTVPTTTVTLTVSGSTATGSLNPITVSDTRNNYPGWSVTGQEANFTGSGSALGDFISGNQLGWVPSETALATGATLGPTVAPAAPGLGTTAAVLASAAPGGGVGTSTLSAALTLDIPATAVAGPYTGSMTITAVTTGP